MPTVTTVGLKLPQSPDVANELMGVLVVSQADRLMRELAPTGARGADPQTLSASFLQSVGINPVLAKLIDFRRPMGAALLNPTLLGSSSVQPYLAMLPITSREKVEATLTQSGVPIERQPWGFVLPFKQGKVYVGFDKGYALLAWRADLLQAAARLIRPRLEMPADAPIVLQIDMRNVNASYGPQLAQRLHRADEVSSGGGGGGAQVGRDPQVAFALRGLRQMGDYLPSVSRLELLLNLDRAGITVTARLDGNAGGEWAKFVAEQRPAAGFGVEFLPRDAVMVYTTLRSPAGAKREIQAAVDYLAESTPMGKSDASHRDRWRNAIERASLPMSGEFAYAVWPGEHGGMGVGGVYRVSTPEARGEIMHMYDELGGQLGGLVARALLLDPERYAKRMTARRRQAKVAGERVDLIEVSVRWPEGAEAERRVFETMFGPKLVMGTAFIGDKALFALGTDWQSRLGTMMRTARGEKANSLGEEPAFADILKFQSGSRVSLSYLETGKMAHFAAALLEQTHDLDAKSRAAIDEVLAQVGGGAIVTTTHASGQRYELTTHIPSSAISGASRLNGAMWRVNLSPLLNPPMIPPLPIPPPHVTPPAHAVSVQGGQPL